MISQLGRYEVLGELGQGAMGVVYKAKDPLIDRQVAIKTINLSLAEDELDEYEGRFYQEAKAAGRLNHPNIVTIYDVGKSGDIAYIAMEFLQGRELRDIMRDDGNMPVDQVLDIVAQVASGLAYAHEHGIVHRDIKPSNIMVIRDGHAKITDFGIARMASSAVRTQTGMVLGSPKYMSPEQVLGKDIDQRSDIFSLGVMLYEMLTGEAPFLGENVNAIMYQTLNAVPKAPSSLNAGVPEMLNFIVAKALAKERDDRYQNAKDFAADLRACREVIPRSNRQIDVASLVVVKKTLDAIVVTGRHGAENGGEDSVITLGLSKSFDSNEATMRLAAMTADIHDVDELAKTLKIAVPIASSFKPDVSGTKPKVAKTGTSAKGGVQSVTPVRSRPVESSAGSNFKFVILFLVIVLLMLLIYVS
ncbi:MAG: serine/threonine protein kinase [Gallionellales bacterium CG_4_10_14_3_um_filter_54_96]|nr:MAG: serine/threonine protein kinase [Gallionellaceae bacterium CG1_02_56_997]PIV14370.1 MAG: serine/threonine protein kinase [Gallionellales bacterium CG03_land_8_20_14_0_80_55_15]PIV91817.1 MAG: serine/threonine protein kinase [Gallionellales bacterium CG17_big_fil_post_rev_8_21_14_2_50_54_146]PIX05263.1 MAG: serine/threonine protein kinase [Gallionellales bacterium CG_4_8_14_3_um_filter_54_18]PIY04302.1 MAG: serine/threonine protein kinase [Gallionellales bacterium CG_4_10_14_3_um_filter_